MRALIAAAALVCAAAAPAWAQFSPCSQTVGTGAAPVAWSGVGSRPPTKYVEICNAHATNTLGVNPSGSAAAIGSAGTRTLSAGQCWAWYGPVPQAISIIGSAASTTTACQYQ
jgi:hypothetical protein